MSTKLADIREELARVSENAHSAQELMNGMVKLLHERMLKYNWVGFYNIEQSESTPFLTLGEFQGAMTPHTRIAMNQGICGAAASSGKTVIVDDVSADARYLACSLETKSEIVVPIFVGGKVVGELDIDSHFPSAFSQEDRDLVEYCAQLVGDFLERSTKA
jgi:L-methionine (R)-S-oxide reductase